MEWQPITTIPKDGTEILVTFVNSGGKAIRAVTKWDGKVWSVSKNKEGELLSVCPISKCTHWMPLPEPPQ